MGSSKIIAWIVRWPSSLNKTSHWIMNTWYENLSKPGKQELFIESLTKGESSEWLE